MKKIFYLKLLIGVITFLIFLTLGGIVYGLVNYKTTPKLLSRKNAPKTVQTVSVAASNTESAEEIALPLQKGERIKATVSCGEMLCLHTTSDFGNDRVLIFDPATLRIRAVLSSKQP